jgi:hypothetical protein
MDALDGVADRQKTYVIEPRVLSRLVIIRASTSAYRAYRPTVRLRCQQLAALAPPAETRCCRLPSLPAEFL